VLLSVALAARRADAAGVIASAITAKVADGRGHRPIAVLLGRPASTVRGWLRSFAASAAPVAEAIAGLLARDAADPAGVWPAPTASPAGRAVAILGAYAGVLSTRLGIAILAWHTVGLAAAGPWLFSSCWPARAGQHQLALTPGPVLPGG
jgi:hypothetical protein